MQAVQPSGTPAKGAKRKEPSSQGPHSASQEHIASAVRAILTKPTLGKPTDKPTGEPSLYAILANIHEAIAALGLKVDENYLDQSALIFYQQLPTFMNFDQELPSVGEAQMVFSTLQQKLPPGIPDDKEDDSSQWVSLSSGNYRVAVQDISPCTYAVIGAVIAAVGIVGSLVGLKVSYSEAAARAIFRELGQETLNGLQRIFHNMSTATSALEKAKLLWSLVSRLGVGGIMTVFKATVSNMSVWGWVKFGITFAAQMTAWLATDGVAFIGEVVLVIMDAVSLTEAIANVVKCC